MPPVSRPIVNVPPGRLYVPASLPSARSAVRTTPAPAPAWAACGGGAACFAAAAPWRRKPHDPQNKLFVALMCPHCGHATVGAPGGGGGAAAGGGGAAACGGGADAFLIPLPGVCGVNGFGAAS